MSLFEWNIFLIEFSLHLLSFLSCIDSREKAFGVFLIMILGPSSLFIWRLVDVSWFSSLYKRCVFSRGTTLSLKLSLYLLSFLSCIDSREKAFRVFLIMIHGPSSLFIWRLVEVSWFSSLYKRCVFSRGTFLSLKPSLYLRLFLSCIDSREEAFRVFLIMIHGPSSFFVWRLVDVSWFSSLYKRCVFSRGTFLSLKLSLYLLSFLSCIDSREKAFRVFLIMIHGPSSLFIWRLVELSWFSSLYKRCVFSRGTILSLKLSLYLLSFLSCIDSREKAFGVFLIMIHGPSSLFIWRLVDVSRFSSLYKRCVFSRGTFFSLKLSLYLLSFLSCIDSREKAFRVFLIMIHGPSSLFIWRLVELSWFSSLYKRCVFSRGTILSLKLSLYLLSFLSCIDSREKAFRVFLIMIHGPSSLFIWRLVEVSWFSSLYKRCVFSRGTFLSLKLSLYLLLFLSCIDSREEAFRVFLIMIHGPSSFFVWRLVDVSWFSSLYKRCVFSRGTFLSLKLSLYLLSLVSCIDSREKAFGVLLIMIHGPSSLFIWRLVDVSWFSSLYKRCVFSRGTFFWLKLSLYLLSFLSCIDSREKAFGVFLIMIHGPSSLFIWRLVDVSRFSSLYKRCVFSRGTFFSLKLSLYLLSFLSCIDSREKAFRVFLIMIHGPSSLFIWRLVELSWFSSLYKRCVFSRGTILSLKLSLYLLSFLSCIDSREKAFRVFLIMIHGPSSLFIWRLVEVSWFSSLYKRCVFSRGTFLSLKLSLYLLLFLSCIDSREEAFRVFLIMIHVPSSFFVWRLVDVSWFSSLYKRCVFSRGTFLSLKLSLYLLSLVSCIDSREKAFGVLLIMIHGPSSLFIWRLVDVSWFSSLNKRCVFSRGTFFWLKLSLYLLSFLSCIDSREKAFGVFLIMIHGPSSLFIWRLVDVSRFSSLYKRCVFSRGTFFSLKLSLYLLSFLSCIDSREKAFRVFLIMIHGPSSLFIWRLVELSWFSSLYKRCVFSRGTILSLKLSLYLLSFLSCIDSREKAFRVFLIMIHGPSSLFIWRLVEVSWFSSLYKRCVFSRGTFLSLKLSLYLLLFLSCIDSREEAFRVFLIMIHVPSSFFVWRLVDVSWFSSLYKRCVFSRGTFLSLKPSLYLLSLVSCIDSREKAFGVLLIMIHGPSSLFIWRLVDVSWFSSLNKRCVFSRGTFFWLKLSLYLLSFLSCIDSREKAFGVFLIMIHGPSSLFIWRLVDVSRFSSLYKRCVFSRGTFFSLKLSLYLLSFLSCIDSREKAIGVFLIKIHGPSSLFIWRLVDVSWFSSL